MQVKLIGYTQPAPGTYDITDVEELIAFCARVSNPSNQFNHETADRLLNYLMKHAHWSPFEMANALFEVTTTRDIARQFLRHRSFSFQEFSQRYADPVKELNFICRNARFQDTKNRQNSILLDLDNPDDRELNNMWIEKQQGVIRVAREAYTWAVENGIAKEVARAPLPEGNTESKMYVNGTIRSWIHYITVRTDPSTQLEHRELAQEIARVLTLIFPYVDRCNKM